WALAERETPRSDVAAYAQAIMDLGASVCIRKNPECGHCPLARDCKARLAGQTTLFPAPRPKRDRPLRRERFVVIERDGAILFEQRPPAGVWGGLLCLPRLGEHDEPAGWCKTRLGLRAGEPRELDGFRHEFTHFRMAA